MFIAQAQNFPAFDITFKNALSYDQTTLLELLGNNPMFVDSLLDLDQ